jgi:hypothetical protein
MAEMEKLMSDELFARVQDASRNLERAMRNARLTEQQMEQVGAALHEYLQEIEAVGKAHQSQTVPKPANPNKKGWTMDDLQPLLDQGAQLIAPIPETKKQ